MKEILFADTSCEIEFDVSGRNLMWRFVGDKAYCICTLADDEAYGDLINKLLAVYDDANNSDEAFGYISDFLQSEDMSKYVDGTIYIRFDPRTEEEIDEYLKEAQDKVWLMRSCHISTKTPVDEAGRSAVERIFNTYDDIPKDGYTDWECGYWNGIMGALRWVCGEEKDFLDT